MSIIRAIYIFPAWLLLRLFIIDITNNSALRSADMNIIRWANRATENMYLMATAIWLGSVAVVIAIMSFFVSVLCR